MWNKLDPSLASLVANYLSAPREGDEGLVNVVVQFRGDIDELRALGFRHLVATEPTRAFGTLHLSDVERITAHPGILKLSFGRAMKPTLDFSVPDVHANQVWHRSGETFSDTTGAGVIVAIIDTGIDWNHPFFRLPAAPNNTRILRIWDTGLTPGAGEQSPPQARLQNGTGTYGVEYTAAQINAALAAGDRSVRSRDCGGHGTHVASIAAGNGRPQFKFIGVAPEADIIAVKLLSPEEPPRIGGSFVPWITRVQDAVTYVLKTVHDDFGDRPVVINGSFGNDTGPHDGFTDEEDWLTTTFAATPGKVFVKSAGNAGNSHQHAEIHFDAAGSTEIPIRLYDTRTKTVDHDLCREQDQTGELELNVYYPAGSPAVTCSLDAPDDGAAFIDGPALGAPPPPVTITRRGWTHTMTHAADDQNLRGGGTVHRSLFKVTFGLNTEKKHWTGDYVLKIAAAGAMTLHLWCDQSRGYGLAINPLLLPDEVVTGSDNESLISQPGGSANVITVAAYRATEESSHEIARVSSRGPLVRYDNTAGLPPTPPKPDIAAPGVGIDAAQSRDIENAKKKYKRTEQFGGTSMAAPHVAGAAALLLQKNHALTAQQVAQLLKDNVHTDRPTDTPNESGAGQLDVKRAIDAMP